MKLYSCFQVLSLLFRSLIWVKNKDAEQKDMELTSYHKYSKSTPKNETVLTEHLLNTRRRLQTYEIQGSPHSWVEWIKEWKKGGVRIGPASLGGNWRRGELLVPWEVPSPTGRSTGTIKQLQRLEGECNTWFMGNRTYIEGLCHLLVHPGLKCIPASMDRS